MALSTKDRDKLTKALDQISEVLEVIVREDLQNALNSTYRAETVNIADLFKEDLKSTQQRLTRAQNDISNVNSRPDNLDIYLRYN